MKSNQLARSTMGFGAMIGRILRDRFGVRAITARGYDGGNDSRLTKSWILSGLSADAEIRAKLWPLRARCRDLEQNNDYVRKFLGEAEANVIGSEGVVMQSKIKETADRVIFDPDEKAFIEDWQEKKQRRRKIIVARLVRRGIDEQSINEWFPESECRLLHPVNGSRATQKVLKGQPDVFACNQVEGGWKRWKKKENCTVTRALEFHEVEKLQLRSTIRDGEICTRKVKGFENDFGFALQLIDADWLDHNFNVVLPNGNEVRMGVEFNQWKQAIAFHFLVKNPGEWLWSSGWGVVPGNNSFSSNRRERVEASEIVHSFMRERPDQSRGVPWLVSVITRLRMLGKYEEAELVASLASSCKGGVWYSDYEPDSGNLPFDTDPDEEDFIEKLEPGVNGIAPFGWKYQQIDPKHPNGNYESFRKGVLRGIAAGLPGATYYGLSQDLESVNFSSMRGGELAAREAWMLIQRWEIDSGLHNPIFPDWLEAALMSGQVALPVRNFEKYNNVAWQGRRWKWVDPVKDITAAILAVKHGFTSRQRVIAEWGGDLEEIFDELAYEAGLADMMGLVFGDAQDAAALQQAMAGGDDAAEEKSIALLASRLISGGRR